MITNKNNDIVFTIIVAVYNNIETIERCIKSVVEQTYKSFQLIIIDAQSNDGTVSVIEAYDEEIDYWISEPDTGIYNAWNKALPHVTGDWVVFLGADDLLLSDDVFLVMKDELNKLDSARLVYSKVETINEKCEFLYEFGRDWNQTKTCIHQYMCIPHQGVFHHCDLFKQYGQFNELFPIVGDYEFIRRVLIDNTPVFVNIRTTKMQIGGISSNPINNIKVLCGYYQVNRLHGALFPGWKLTFSYFAALIKLLILSVLGNKLGNRLISLILKTMGKPGYQYNE